MGEGINVCIHGPIMCVSDDFVSGMLGLVLV